MPTLRVQTADQAEAVYVLTGEKVTVGRRPDNTIQLLDRSVSAHHAEFQLVDSHYRLHDLQSTNLTLVDGTQVADYHLHGPCHISFGNVECMFDPLTIVEMDEVKLSPLQMEKDLAFLRADNQELLNKIDSLQRRVDILSSARLVTSKGATHGGSASEELERIGRERDELRFQNSGLRLELERLREELTATGRERDQARRAYELLQVEHSSLREESKTMDKGTTQRIIFPAVAQG